MSSTRIEKQRNWIGRLLAGCLVCCCLCSLATAATVQFKSHANIQGEVVRLGDVAEVYDFNPQVAERLKQIILRPAPAAGLKIRISVDEVRSRLKSSGVNMLAVEMQGSTQIEVASASAPGPIQQVSYTQADPTAQARQLQQAVKALKQSIQQYLQAQQLSVKPEQIELEISRQQLPLLKHFTPTAYHVQGGQAPWTAPQQLKISLLDDQKSLQSILVNVSVKAGPTALVPRYQIPRGQSLTRDDFESIPVDRLTATMVTTYEELEGKEAVQPLAAGRPVQQNQMKPIVLVRRNAMVKVFVNSKGIQVRTLCKALKEGSQGEVIPVEPQWKTKTRPTPINVRVTGVNEAVVDSGDSLAN
ncbi:MAG: flagellar basal body P-ring formation protein FlgA [Planctomycetaceae bacterium]|nr:flagellar basal body P-ring formation protein FlgA [Planctomycetaceae bacterium]